MVPKKTEMCKKSFLEGNIFWVAGNQMPGPGQGEKKFPGYKTTLYIYELTNASDAKKAPIRPFYFAPSTKLIKTIETDAEGHFKTEIAPGKYSLFVKKADLFFANQFDEKNNLFPVTVSKKKTTKVIFKADWEAAY